MEMAYVVILQTLVMFLLMAVGYILFKTNKITIEGSKSIANLLVYVIIPIVIVKSFCKEPTRENIINFGVSAGVGLLALIISILVSRLFFNKSPLDDFATAFSNVGFFGIPLIEATIGDSGVFFIVPIIAFVNIGQWTYGVMRITEKPLKEVFAPKKLLVAPFVIATIVGLVLFFTGAGHLMKGYEFTNKVVYGVIDALSAVNTPLAMVVIGVYLAQTDFKSLFTTKSVYAVCLVRLIVIPLVLLGVFYFIPNEFYAIKMAIYLASI